MSQITVYTTEPCGYCRVAKALLAKRGVQYEEINLAKDPEGRAELVRLTGMMTFPQVVIDGQSIGGYQELVAFDRAGRVAEFAAPPRGGGGVARPPGRARRRAGPRCARPPRSAARSSRPPGSGPPSSRPSGSAPPRARDAAARA